MQADQKIIESERQFRSIVENTIDGIIIINEDSKIIYANEGAKKISGYSPEEVIGKDFSAYLDEDSKTLSVDRYKRRQKGEDVPNIYEVVLVRKDGVNRTIKVSASAFKEAAGQNRTVVIFSDVTELKQAEDALKRKDQEQDAKIRHIEEANTALRIFLRQKDEDKQDFQTKVLSNVKELVLPFLDKLKITEMNDTQKAYVDILETNLNEIISPFLGTVTSQYLNFTPREIQIANLIRAGKPTKEIARLIGVTKSTIDLHRNHIRNKMGLNNKKVNLRSYLLSLSS
jgi:PAS domain S-box-containing protein